MSIQKDLKKLSMLGRKTKEWRKLSKKLGKEMWEKYYYEDPLLKKAREVAKNGREFVEYVCQNVKNTDEDLFPQAPGAPPRQPRRITRQRSKDLKMVDSPYFPIIDLDKLFAEHKGLLTRKPSVDSDSDDDRPPKSGINFEGSLCILNPDKLYNDFSSTDNSDDEEEEEEEKEEEQEQEQEEPSTSKVQVNKGRRTKVQSKKASRNKGGLAPEVNKGRRMKVQSKKAARNKRVLASVKKGRTKVQSKKVQSKKAARNKRVPAPGRIHMKKTYHLRSSSV